LASAAWRVDLLPEVGMSYPISPDVFLFLGGSRDGAFRVIPVTSDSGFLVSRPLRLALKGFERRFPNLQKSQIDEATKNECLKSSTGTRLQTNR